MFWFLCGILSNSHNRIFEANFSIRNRLKSSLIQFRLRSIRFDIFECTYYILIRNDVWYIFIRWTYTYFCWCATTLSQNSLAEAFVSHNDSCTYKHLNIYRVYHIDNNKNICAFPELWNLISLHLIPFRISWFLMFNFRFSSHGHIHFQTANLQFQIEIFKNAAFHWKTKREHMLQAEMWRIRAKEKET